MDSNLIDIYDTEINLLGVADKKQAHEEGLWHKVFHCWIISEDGNLWLPRRKADNSLHPKLLDITCSQHILVGDTPKKCGINELENIYSLKVKEHDLTKMFTHKMVFDTPFKNREFCPTYLLKTQYKFSDLTILSDEFDSLYIADIQDLIDLFLNDIKNIPANGIKIKSQTTTKKNISKADFCPYGDKYYQKVFTTIQRFIDNQ
jgi:isopentenyldiphosphate isomerase